MVKVIRSTWFGYNDKPVFRLAFHVLSFRIMIIILCIFLLCYLGDDHLILRGVVEFGNKYSDLINIFIFSILIYNIKKINFRAVKRPKINITIPNNLSAPFRIKWSSPDIEHVQKYIHSQKILKRWCIKAEFLDAGAMYCGIPEKQGVD